MRLAFEKGDFQERFRKHVRGQFSCITCLFRDKFNPMKINHTESDLSNSGLAIMFNLFIEMFLAVNPLAELF